MTKGPASAKNKKLFYVYGRGWNAMDGNRTLPTLTKEEGEDYSWPQRRQLNSCYYKLMFDLQGDCFIYFLRNSTAIDNNTLTVVSSTGPKVQVKYCHHLASVVCCLSSVNFSHFKLLLRNHWADLNQT